MYIMIFTRRTPNKTPVVAKPMPDVKKQVVPIKFAYNMFAAVSKFSNCDSCDKVN